MSAQMLPVLRQSIRTVTAMMLLVALSACNDGLSGEYGTMRDGEWKAVMTFKDGMVELDIMGMARLASPYEVKDGKLYMTIEGSTMVYQIAKDGCIDGGRLLGHLCKQR